MSTVTIGRFITLLSAGMLAGILFGDRWGATRVRPVLSDSCFISFQQGLHTHFVPMMPILIIVATLSAAVLAWGLRRSGDRSGLLLTVCGLSATLFIFVLTRIVNVPINELLMTWSAAAPPADRLRAWAPWEQAHTVRTLVAIAGFCCHLLAAIRTPQPAAPAR